jgi:hypothetical protein
MSCHHYRIEIARMDYDSPPALDGSPTEDWTAFAGDDEAFTTFDHFVSRTAAECWAFNQIIAALPHQVDVARDIDEERWDHYVAQLSPEAKAFL